MKFSKAHYATTFVGLVAVLAVGTGCGAADSNSSEPAGTANQEIVSNLQKAGFPKDDIQEIGGRVYVGNDAVVSLEASREMLKKNAVGSKLGEAALPGSSTGAVNGNSLSPDQYRTSNLVSSGVSTICIDGSAFDGDFSTALDNAIANYNNLSLSFSMQRADGGGSGCDATITANLTGGSAGGVSGFPSGGSPYSEINIASSTSQYGLSVLTHVITHELGHTVGLRHSDYYNRSISCGGSATNEGSGGVGAIHISGTPTTATVGGSVMNSCFNGSENGRFTSTDVTALRTIY